MDKFAQNNSSLQYNNVNTDKAKDSALMGHNENADKVGDALRAKGLKLGGVEFFDHNSRRDVSNNHVEELIKNEKKWKDEGTVTLTEEEIEKQTILRNKKEPKEEESDKGDH